MAQALGHNPNFRTLAAFNHQHDDGHRPADRQHSKPSFTQVKAHAMWGNDGESSQDSIQVIILLIAVISVPIMLLPKPIIEIKRLNRKKQYKQHQLLVEELEAEREAKVNASEENAGVMGIKQDDHSH